MFETIFPFCLAFPNPEENTFKAILMYVLGSYSHILSEQTLIALAVGAEP